jgi:hypothetical protein
MKRRLAGLAGGCAIAVALAGCSSTTRSVPATVGSTLTLNDGTGDTINVTLLKFQDPATPAGSADAPPAGDSLAEVLLKVTGITGTYQYSATTAVALIGSDKQTYSAGSESLIGCSGFKGGQVTVTAGHTVTGCVAVEIKKTIKAAKVEYDAGYVGTTGVWIP